MPLYRPTSGANPVMTSPLWQSGRYYYAPASMGASALNSLTKETERAVPFYTPNAVTLTRIGMQVTSAGDAGSKIRLGVRADDGTGRPGTLLLDAGVIAGDSASVQEITISLAIAANVQYWVSGTTQIVTTTVPSVDAISGSVFVVDLGTSAPTPNNNNYGRGQTGITGALPGTWTDAGNTANSPRFFLKVA